MFNWKEFEKTKVILSQSSSYYDFGSQHNVIIRPIDLVRWIEMIREDLGFLTLVEISGADIRGIFDNDYDFNLTYHFLNMGSHQRLNIHVRFFENEIIPSIIELFTHADWLEREQREAFGIKFSRPMKNLFYNENTSHYPLRKDAVISSWGENPEPRLPTIEKNPNKSESPFPEEAFEWKLFDIVSPQACGLFEWQVCFDPLKVIKSNLNVGFYHEGLEKLLEKKDWQQILHLVDKINLGSAPTYSIAWAKTLEDLLRIKLPERAQAIRIVVLEMARIAEHLTVMHEITYSLGMDEHRLFINCREKIYELMEKYCGRRQGLGVARLGGIKEDLPHGWIVEYQSVYEIIFKSIKTIHRSLISQVKFRESLSTGEVSAQTALEWGISGPAMRASGLNFDLRKSQGFYFYQDIDFDIPVGIHGTAYERYLIRFEEIFQSFRIITQVIDNLPLGEIVNSDFDKNYLDLKNYLRTLNLPRGWQYTGIESPNGEAGFLVMFDGKADPLRVKIKTPSFALAQALPHFIHGMQEAQINSSLASMGIRRFELDR